MAGRAKTAPGSVCEELLSNPATRVETVILNGTLARSARPPDQPENPRPCSQGSRRQHARSSYVRAAVRAPLRSTTPA